MAIGSGLSASIGVAEESTYGTYVAPTRFLEFTKEDLKRGKTILQGGGLAAGRYALAGSRRVVSTVMGSGSYTGDVPNKGFGLLIAHLLGSAATPAQQGATTAYLQTHELGDTYGMSLSVQKGVPDTTGTVRPYSFLGGKITGGEFSCTVGGLLESTLNFDFQNVSEAQSLAAPSYATGLAPFHGGQMTVKLGTFGSETAISGVTKISVKLDRSLATERFYAGSGSTPAVKSEPITNDYIKISGSLDADYVTKTEIADLVASDADTALLVEWVGPVIAGAYNETFRIKLPMIFFDGDTPTVEGPDLVNTSYDFVAQDDGTNSPIIVEYISTDTNV